MAKWDFKIVGASFVKELVPIADDVQPRSQSFMQPSFHLEGGKIVMKESGQYVTAIYFSQIGEIDGVAPTDIDDAYAKLLTLVENFNGGGGTPQNLAQVLAIDNKTNDIPIVSNNGVAVVDVNDNQLSLSYDQDSINFYGVQLDIVAGFLLNISAQTNMELNSPNVAIVTDTFYVPSNYTNLVSSTSTSIVSATSTTLSASNSVNISTPSFKWGLETVATQPYADAKVANDLTASTTVAPSKTAVFDALDFTRRLITKGTGSVTGTVSETIITTLTVPANTLDSSCFIWTTMDFFKTNNGTVTIRLYINNANTLTGATLLGYSTLGSNRNVSFNRKFLVTGTSLDLLTANTASIQVTNEFIEALYGASTVLTINPSADIFLIYTTQNDATGTVATNKMATVQKMKL